jgi:hypothetical protein
MTRGSRSLSPRAIRHGTGWVVAGATRRAPRPPYPVPANKAVQLTACGVVTWARRGCVPAAAANGQRSAAPLICDSRTVLYFCEGSQFNNLAETKVKVKVATSKIRSVIIEQTTKYVDALVQGRFDYIYEELITSSSLELLATMAWPLILRNRGQIDFLFSKLNEDPETDIVDVLSFAFQTDEEECRTGVFRGIAEKFVANQWHEFDKVKPQCFIDGKFAVLVSGTPTKPLFMTLMRQKDDTYLIDFEALWLFSMSMNAGIIIEVADRALTLHHRDMALEYYSLAAKLKSVYQRIENLITKHPIVGKFITPTRKFEMQQQLQISIQAQERFRLLKQESSLNAQENLSLEEYENILGVITNMALVIERSPEAFKGLREEHIRNHFLVQLNGRYPGSATGETFNANGKTDILLRRDDVNLFVAECKYWKSAQSFKEAINQLLGYATWRDTKLALIVFSRNKNFSDVVSQLPDLVKSHQNYHQQLNYTSETGFRFILRHQEDPKRLLIITVLAFNIPQ